MTTAAPVLMPHEKASQGVDSDYFAKGYFRTMSYQAFIDAKRRADALAGTRSREPEVRTDNGLLDGVQHAADPDEIIEHFTKLGQMIARSAGSSSEEQEKARQAKEMAELGELGKLAATGDPVAMQEAVRRSLEVLRATDPMILPQPYASPGDFLAQYPVPLDTTELITLCEETGLYRALPEVVNGSQTESWREMTALAFLTGCNNIAFEEGGCPEEYSHEGGNLTQHKKHIGAKQTLSDSDIVHSAASVAAGYGMRELVGGFNDQGLPGERDVATMLRANIADLKAKEMKLASILVLNGWDQQLVDGDDTNTEEFDGLATQITVANGARCNSSLTGTFSVTDFDQFLAAGCARPQAVIGHPTALAAISLAYFAIGSQTVFFNDNANIVPGLHFAGSIMTGIGPVDLIADSRFPRDAPGPAPAGFFDTTVYPVRLTHNGEPLIYKATQIPLSAKDLAPGCTAISFLVWAVTALVVKAMCAQACYRARFAGLVSDGCTYIHPCITNT